MTENAAHDLVIARADIEIDFGARMTEQMHVEFQAKVVMDGLLDLSGQGASTFGPGAFARKEGGRFGAQQIRAIFTHLPGKQISGFWRKFKIDRFVVFNVLSRDNQIKALATGDKVLVGIDIVDVFAAHRHDLQNGNRRG